MKSGNDSYLVVLNNVVNLPVQGKTSASTSVASCNSWGLMPKRRYRLLGMVVCLSLFLFWLYVE